ncbi:hypothetical protein FRB90_004274, partial [Tulasnella sp. 427]
LMLELLDYLCMCIGWKRGSAVTDRLSERDEEDSSSTIDAHEATALNNLAHALLDPLSRKRIEVNQIELPEGVHVQSKSGGKGDVVMATLPQDADTPPRRVAVKQLKFSRNIRREKLLKAFVNELRVLDRLAHPHVIEMIGFAEEIQSEIAWMIFPWEANGNVREFVRSGEWDLPERVSLLNILVNGAYRAVIADFGSARVMRTANELGIGESDLPTEPTGEGETSQPSAWNIELSAGSSQLTLSGPGWTLRWAAPEILNGEKSGLASDVWALGWICWEIFTGNFPFSETNALGLITFKVVAGHLPSIDAQDQLSQIRSLCSMMLDCWKPKHEDRPSIGDCMKRLSWIPASIPSVRQGEGPTIRSAALLMQLGEIHRLHDRNDEAAQMLERGLRLAQSTGDKSTLGGCILRLAYIQRAQSKHAEAEQSFTEALEIFRTIGDGFGQATSLHGLGNINRTRSNYAEAEVFYTEAMKLHTMVRDDSGRAYALLRLGDGHQARSNYVEAEKNYSEALKFHTSIGNETGRASVMQRLGDFHYARSDYVKAEALYNQALETNTSIGNRFGRADVLNGLGNLYRAQSKYPEAKESYTQARDIYTGIGNVFGRATALTGLGSIHHAESKHDEAEEFWRQALAIYTEIGYVLGQADSMSGLGKIHKVRSNYAEAEDAYTGALNIYASVGNALGSATALRELGDVYRVQLRYTEAEESYVKGLEAFRSIKDEFGETDLLIRICELRIGQSRFTEARFRVNEAVQLAQRLDHLSAKSKCIGLLEDIAEAEKALTRLEDGASIGLRA